MAEIILNKDQAIAEMKKGNKLTHASFTDTEWVTIQNNKMVFEDGCKCSQDEFWKYRQIASWNYYWQIFKSN